MAKPSAEHALTHAAVAKSSSPARIAELDGVRGIAALLVVYQHLFLSFIPGEPRLLFWLRTASGMAWTGVHLFFVLSGFLIGGILMENRQSPNYFSVFYTRRALRILPLYFLLLGVFFGVRALIPTFSDAVGASPIAPWQYFTMLQNFPMAQHATWGFAPLSITWSVAIEEQFYLFLPVLIWIVPQNRQLACFVVLAAAAPVFRMISGAAHAAFLMPGALDSLLLGTIIAWTIRHRPRLIGGMCFQACCAGILLITGILIGLMATKRDLGPFRETTIAVFWGAFLSLVFANLNRPITSFFRWEPLVQLGRISYGIYLLHVFCAFTVGLIAKNIQGQTEGPRITTSIVAFVLVLLIAQLLFRYFESPLIRIGSRFRYKKPHSDRPAPIPAKEPEVAVS